jgi:uncharacterized protein (TIGR00369 family)
MNADKALIKRFLANPSTPLAVDSNELAKALKCRILAADAGEGTVRLDFEPGAMFLQGNKAVQGGAVSAMLDFAMAFAALAALPDDQGGATTSMTVSFLRPVLEGRYVAAAGLDRVGRSLVFASAELRDAGTDKLAATATCVMAVVTAT